MFDLRSDPDPYSRKRIRGSGLCIKMKRIRNTDFMDKIIDQMKVNPGQDIDRRVSTDRRNGRNGKNGQTQWKERTDGTYRRNLKTERSDGTDERIELMIESLVNSAILSIR